MVKRINMNPLAAAKQGPGLPDLTAAGNPWTLADGLADELVNRTLATQADLPQASPALVTSSGGKMGANGGVVGFTVIKDGTTPLARILRATGDLKGVGDRDAAMEASAYAALVGGGRFEFKAGTHWRSSTDAAGDNLDKGVPLVSGMEIEFEAGAQVKVVPGSKCNVFLCEGISNFALRKVWANGSRSNALLTANSQDAWRNGARIVSCTDFEIDDCQFDDFSYHAIIMTNSSTNARITNNRFNRNGFRCLHGHDESGGVPGKIYVAGNVTRNGGAGLFPGLSVQAQVLGGALDRVRINAADLFKFQALLAANITALLFRIPGAGVGGAVHFSQVTLSAGNPDVNLDITLTIPAPQANGGVVTVSVLAEMTSGFYMVLGTEDIQILNNQAYGETAQGFHLGGSPTAGSDRIELSGNTADLCGIGFEIGSNNGNAIRTVSGVDNHSTRSLFEGMRIGNVTNLNVHVDIADSGTAGVSAVSIGGLQETLEISGSIRNSGGPNFYARGSGEIQQISVTAALEGAGQNAGFNVSTATLLGTRALGWGQGALLRHDVVDKFRSVVIRSLAVKKNVGGGIHIDGATHADVSGCNLVDNCSAGNTGDAIRLLNVKSGRVSRNNIRALAKVPTGWAATVEGTSTNVLMEGNATNYTKASPYQLMGAGSEAKDNNGPAGFTVTLSSGAVNASDASNQRTA